MNHYTYEVIKESEGHPQHAYSRTEVLDRFDNARDALKMCDTLRKEKGDWFFVQVQWGSIDNV